MAIIQIFFKQQIVFSLCIRVASKCRTSFTNNFIWLTVNIVTFVNSVHSFSFLTSLPHLLLLTKMFSAFPGGLTVRDLQLSLLWLRSFLWGVFYPGPGTLHATGMAKMSGRVKRNKGTRSTNPVCGLSLDSTDIQVTL